MLRSVTKEFWLKSLHVGDIGICLGTSIFSKFQNISRNLGREGDKPASHGFFVKISPWISEADGRRVTGHNKISRYFSDHHKIWIFRYPNLTQEQIDDMNLVVSTAEKVNGQYSWGGIKEFWKPWFGIPMKERAGVFCTEFTSAIIRAANLPYMDKKDFEISPSRQREWFQDYAVPRKIVNLALYYENGKFYTEEEII